MKRIDHKTIDGKEHKWCGRCKRWLPLDCFNKNRVKWDGLQEQCGECRRAEWRLLHPVKPKPVNIKPPKQSAAKELLPDGNGWVTIPDFPNYQITKEGRVRNRLTGKERKINSSKRGYSVVSLRKDGKFYLRTIHRLLAEMFIPNPDGKPEINHIDGNKTNYSLSNLEWVTKRENLIHARNTGLHKSDGDKAIGQFKDGQLIRTFKSASEASRILGIQRCCISSCARGNTRLKTYKGYEWKFV